MYLAGKLDALARSSSVSHHPTAGERPPGERRRRTYEYAVSGARVCVAVFLFAHNCSRYLLHKIEAHLAAGCVGFTEHGGTGKAPWNVTPEEEMQTVVCPSLKDMLIVMAFHNLLLHVGTTNLHPHTYLVIQQRFSCMENMWRLVVNSPMCLSSECGNRSALVLLLCVEHALIYNLEFCAPGQRRIELTQPNSFTRI